MRLCGAEIEYLHNTYVARGLQNMTVQPFYGKGPHSLLRADLVAARANTTSVVNVAT